MINVIDEIYTYKETDLELFEQARRRVQGKLKGRCVRNKDVIIDKEKEIIYYRDKIEYLTNIIKNKEQRIDYKTETFYADGEVIREVTTQYK